MIEIVVKIYKDASGNVPYLKWFRAIQDPQTRMRIQQRIRRLGKGNFGNCKNLKDGINELKLDFGPGYRVYYGLEGNTLVILLYAGNKSSQTAGVEKAKKYWRSYKERENNGISKF